MALAITDADTAAASATTVSATLNLGSTSNAYFAFVGCANNATDAATSATLGGGSITLNGPITLNGNRWYWMGGNTSLTGDQSLQVNWDAGSFHRLFVISFSGAHATSPIGTPVTAGATSGTSLSFGSISSATGDIVVGFAQENNGTTLTPGTGGSYISPFTSSSTFAHGFQEPGASSVTFDATFSGSSHYFGIAVNIAAAAAGGGGQAPRSMNQYRQRRA